MSVVSFWYNYSTNLSVKKKEVENFIRERAERESITFQKAQVNLDILAKEIKKELSKKINYEKEFEHLFEKRSSGVYRKKIEIIDGETSILAYAKKGFKMTPELKNRFVLLHKIIESYGKAWSGNWMNLWVSGIEDYNIVYWPNFPLEILNSFPDDYSFLDKEFMKVGLPENNPSGKPIWTGPYFDLAYNDWMISLNHPIYINGKYSLSIGVDILLSDFFERAFTNIIEGTYNIVIDQNGRLISHPDYVEEVKESNGQFYINEKNIPELNKLIKYISDTRHEVIQDKSMDALVGFDKIDGPEWKFILVYPLNLIRRTAQETAIFIIILGIISLLFELLMLYQVIQKYLAVPIEKLTKAANMIASGNHNSRVEVESTNEIGALASSFNIMSQKVEERDNELQEQALLLEKKVEIRTRELDRERARTFEASKLATLGRMAGGVSHEINNPLSTILLLSDSMKRKINKGNVNTDEIVNNLKKIDSTVFKISNIVKGLSSVSKNADSDLILPVDVQKLINMALELCGETLRTHNIHLECEDVPQVAVLCRQVQIVQTMITIIHNSIDALENIENKYIRIYVETNNTHTSIIIEDNGEGIPKEIQDKIMTPFFTTKEIGKGTGLSLFIAYGVLISNRGSLSFDSKEGRTRFKITLQNKN